MNLPVPSAWVAAIAQHGQLPLATLQVPSAEFFREYAAFGAAIKDTPQVLQPLFARDATPAIQLVRSLLGHAHVVPILSREWPQGLREAPADLVVLPHPADLFATAMLQHVPVLDVPARLLAWLPDFLIAAHQHSAQPEAFVAVYAHIASALVKSLDGWLVAPNLPITTRELAMRVALGLLTVFTDAQSPLHLASALPWSALAPPLVGYIARHANADPLAQQALATLVHFESVYLQAIWTACPLKQLSDVTRRAWTTAVQCSHVVQLLLAEIPSMSNWPVDSLVAVVDACAQVAIGTSKLDQLWHAAPRDVAAQHAAWVAQFSALWTSVATQVLMHNPALMKTMLQNDRFLTTLPALLMSHDKQVRLTTGQLLAHVLGTQSQFNTRKQLMTSTKPHVLERASFSIIRAATDWNSRRIIRLDAMFPLIQWIADVCAMPSAVVPMTLVDAATEYLASFYKLGLRIGNHEQISEADYNIFEATQDLAHKAVRALLNMCRLRTDPWPPSSKSFADLVDMLAKWARVTDEIIAQAIFELLDEVLKLARKRGFEVSEKGRADIEKIAIDDKGKKSRFSVDQRSVLFQHVSFLEARAKGVTLPADDDVKLAGWAAPSKPALPQLAPPRVVDLTMDDDDEGDVIEVVASTSAPKSMPGTAPIKPSDFFRPQQPRKTAAPPSRPSSALASRAPTPPVPSAPAPSSRFAGVQLRKPKTKEELLAEEERKRAELVERQRRDEAVAREKMLAGMEQTKERLRSGQLRKHVQGVDLFGAIKAAAPAPRAAKPVRISAAAASSAPRERRRAHPPLPDPKSLEIAVVQWDYHAVDSAQPVPVGLHGTDVTLRCSNVPDTFRGTRQYYDVFSPLILLECWQQLERAKAEHDGSYVDVQVQDLAIMSESAEVTVTIPLPEWRAVTKSRPQDMDVVLLADERGMDMNAKSRGVTSDALLDLLASDTAVVPKRDGLAILAKINAVNYMRQMVEIKATVSLRANTMVPGRRIRMMKLFSLVTAYREFSALVTLPLMPLVDEILDPKAGGSGDVEDEDRAQVARARRAHGLNEPQAKAVVRAVRSPGITLIQGPPGTGKTKTILGLIGAFLQRTPHILVCAPSNAAVDEITKRVLRGVRDDTSGAMFVPTTVRVGNTDVVHPDVRSVALDDLVDEEMQGAQAAAAAGENGGGGLDATWRQLLAERRQVLDDKSRLEGMLADAHQQEDSARAAQLEMDLKALHAHRRKVLADLDAHRQQRTETSRAVEASRMQTRQRILERAQVVTCTLSTAGQDQLAGLDHGFDVVIIDEAAQSIELSSLIPLRFGAKQVVLVGDPNQLPPTVLSLEAKKYGYEQSLFVRVQKARPERVVLLEIQYRMHPDISYFPSQIFYDGKLRDGVSDETHIASWYTHASGLFGPIRFFDVVGGRQQGGGAGRSLRNVAELDAVLHLVHTLVTAHPNTNFCSRIGIITPYKDQKSALRDRLRQVYGPDVLEYVDVNTVDGFQGQEKDIIIMTTVRAGDSQGGIGFVADQRRMNVALTRAKYTLLVVGSAAALTQNKCWRQLVGHAKEKGVFRTLEASKIPRVHGPCPPNLRPTEYHVGSGANGSEGGSAGQGALKRAAAEMDGPDGAAGPPALTRQEKRARNAAGIAAIRASAAEMEASIRRGEGRGTLMPAANGSGGRGGFGRMSEKRMP
ncbi:hypothetical protein AMAG_15807 [Allomyces macrogynus ATCC 38327]|uniref:UvrD-like helicase ATP-binding domain-containing protein n=1 Tax=Allomyces macrogynus (strain ATCC 38327) TaxID=578462 RepID=A0A0L0T8U0_ALLM3|nr:hypothetical protein AMAG_15807 [Allomyces macrogynus ATCC 38327]|eukprot:KNE71140.1 hypothetical protein AMAG_15807 [Allomyces macrogynus ATCC 38327]